MCEERTASVLEISAGVQPGISVNQKYSGNLGNIPTGKSK